MIEVDGIDGLMADFTKAGLMAGLRAAKVVEDSSRKTRDMARQLAPRTGLPHYANAITYEVTIDGLSVTGEVGPERGGQGSLAHILEFGTSRTPPHAHLGPALDYETPAFVKRLGDIAGL